MEGQDLYANKAVRDKQIVFILGKVPTLAAAAYLQMASKPPVLPSNQLSAKNHGAMAESMAGDNGKGPEITLQAAVLSNTGMDSLDDFGVDLYAIFEPVTSKIDVDKNTRIAAMLSMTATEWQRQTHEGFSGGRGSGRGGYRRGGATRGGGSGNRGRALMLLEEQHHHKAMCVIVVANQVGHFI